MVWYLGDAVDADDADDAAHVLMLVMLVMLVAMAEAQRTALSFGLVHKERKRSMEISLVSAASDSRNSNGESGRNACITVLCASLQRVVCKSH